MIPLLPKVTVIIPVAARTGICVIALLAGCSASDEVEDRERARVTQRTIEEVLKDHTEEWLSLPGVVGTAIGECDGQPCIRILVARRTPELEESIPRVADGYPVDIHESGPIRALDPDSQPPSSAKGGAK